MSNETPTPDTDLPETTGEHNPQESTLPGLPTVITTPEEVKYPEAYTSAPIAVQQVLTLIALGHTFEEVATLTKLTKQTIKNYVNRYDPDGLFCINPLQRQALAKARWEHIESLAISHLVQKDLSTVQPVQLATIAAIARDKAEKIILKTAKEEEPKPVTNLLDKL